MKKFAFTLAELLIVMTIVGVIAVLTIPGVTRNVFERSNKIKLKTTYETLSTALRTLLVNEHVTNLGDTTMILDGDDGLEDFFTTYLKVTNECGTTGNGCYASAYKSPNRTYSYTVSSSSSDFGGTYCAMLNTAAVLCATTGTYETGSVIFWVDVNGEDSPNILTKDLFLIAFNEKGELDWYSDSSDDYPSCDYTDGQINTDLETTVMSCTASILSEEI